MIQGNDGGVYLSQDGGKNWRFADSLPIEQFYQVAADSKQPYDVCGGLQDNNGWCGPSAAPGPFGNSRNDWFTVVGGDGQYAVPAPSDPNIIYADSQDGFIIRYNLRDHCDLALNHSARLAASKPRIRNTVLTGHRRLQCRQPTPTPYTWAAMWYSNPPMEACTGA